MQDTIKTNLINALGLESLTETEQEEALLRIGNIIFQSTLMRVLEELDEAAKAELDKLLSLPSRDEEAILMFLRARVQNFDEIMNEEVVRFKSNVEEFMAKATGKVDKE